HVTLDTQPVAARVEPPIQVTQIVAGLVIAVVAELDAKPVKRAVMQPAEEAFHDVARFEIQSLQRRQQFRVEALGQGLDRGGRRWDMGYGIWDPAFHLPSSIFHLRHRFSEFVALSRSTRLPIIWR